MPSGRGRVPLIPIAYPSLSRIGRPDSANLPFVLAARSAVAMVSTPLGTAIGGPLVGSLGASGTLTASGVATVLLAAAAAVLWSGKRAQAPTSAT